MRFWRHSVTQIENRLVPAEL